MGPENSKSPRPQAKAYDAAGCDASDSTCDGPEPGFGDPNRSEPQPTVFGDNLFMIHTPGRSLHGVSTNGTHEQTAPATAPETSWVPRGRGPHADDDARDP